ncbi:zinc ribbon-containing protein [Methylicorpusculum oleiharenae]|uniref:zinc ribbon-containing protein n=1 Tax=Methylicorpusculum oleiharenae TaxID=1338687 RepID=UPI0013571F67|nr:zinc ribbon-containing protein [Methylicorpusculum oleiharenae]MCD2449326.1 zinc ribbon-containing protein [Methylicorpusculum oleiharenae]
MSDNKLIEAYNDLMGHLYEVMDDGIHSLANALEKAKEKTSEIGGVTQEELSKISDYVKRDVEHAAHALNEDGTDDLSEWLKFDIDLIENFALDAFMSVADKTSVELAKLKTLAEQNTYHSGEVTGPGTFVCDQCNKEIAFKTTSVIPKCPACGADTFFRC